MRDGDFVTILEVASHARQWHADGYPVLAQMRFGTDPREHEELRRVEGSPAEDHFATGADAPVLAGVVARCRVGPVEMLALQVLDADRGVRIIEHYPRCQRMGLDVQVATVLGGCAQQALAAARAGVVR